MYSGQNLAIRDISQKAASRKEMMSHFVALMKLWIDEGDVCCNQSFVDTFRPHPNPKCEVNKKISKEFFAIFNSQMPNRSFHGNVAWWEQLRRVLSHGIFFRNDLVIPARVQLRNEQFPRRENLRIRKKLFRLFKWLPRNIPVFVQRNRILSTRLALNLPTWLINPVSRFLNENLAIISICTHENSMEQANNNSITL